MLSLARLALLGPAWPFFPGFGSVSALARLGFAWLGTARVGVTRLGLAWVGWRHHRERCIDIDMYEDPPKHNESKRLKELTL